MARQRKPASELFADALDGDRSALARLLSLIERGDDEAPRGPVDSLIRVAGDGYTIGLTGAPGAGKSTLTSASIGHLRSLELEIAVLAIDPSSPFTGRGDSWGPRANAGSRNRSGAYSFGRWPHVDTWAASRLPHQKPSVLLDAIGRRWIVVETVGVGQVEVEVAGKADTTVVVVNPGWGDSVQANKAGLMEIADIFVINKADRKGVDETSRDLMQMLDLSDMPHEAWRPPIISAVGTNGAGGVSRNLGSCARTPCCVRGIRRAGSATDFPSARGIARDHRPAARSSCSRRFARAIVGTS